MSPLDVDVAQSARRDSLPRMLWAVAAGDALVFGLSFAVFGFGTEGLLRAARYTARFSFLLFVVAFVATSLAQGFPSAFTRNLSDKRHAWLLGFALAHFIHLGALGSYLLVSGKPANLALLIGGGVGYAFVALLALTSRDLPARALRPERRARLHAIGIHYVWLVFAYSYLARALKKTPQEPRWIYEALLAISLLALAGRVFASLSQRRKSAG